jgi:hypothetical protein
MRVSDDASPVADNCYGNRHGGSIADDTPYPDKHTQPSAGF